MVPVVMSSHGGREEVTVNLNLRQDRHKHRTQHRSSRYYMSLCKVRWQKKAPGARDQVSKAAEVLKPETHQGRQGTMRLEMTTTCNPNFGASWEEKAILPEQF